MEPIRVESRPQIGSLEANNSDSGTESRWSESLRLGLVGVLFCVSGLPALVYQIVWQRILALHSGVGIYSVAMIVSSFMAGLGIGSFVGGAISKRVTARKALRVFAWIELGIGLCGAVSAPLYYDVLYLRASWLYDATWRAGLGHFCSLLIPTCLMGMSLPVLARATVREVRSAGRTIGLLYGLNVLGAALGAFLTPWVLIRHWGIRPAILVGVGCNALAGLTAWVLSRGSCSESPEDGPSESPSRDAELGHVQPVQHAFTTWLMLYALCGFNGLGLEMVWFRLCDVAAKSTAFTFGTVLAVYLFGLGAGSLIGVQLVTRIARPLRAFLLCQCWILVYSTAAVLLLAFVPSYLPGMEWLLHYWQGYDGVVPGQGVTPTLLLFYLVFPVLLFGLPTVLMGVSFCVLQRAVHTDRHTSGFKVGVLQAANIVGCVAGSLIVGLHLLTRMGTTGTMCVLGATGFGFVVLGILKFGWRSVFVPLGMALAALVVFMPSQDRLWMRLHGLELGSTPWAFVEEDATGVVAITPEKQGTLRLSVDGKGHSWLPFGSIHSLLGAVPAVVHASPRDVAIIGLGSGDTAWAAACRPETQRVAVFELCAPQERLLRRLASSATLPSLQRFLSDGRVRIVLADGRNALSRDEHLYDLIEADASRPETAYGGNLYSIEFFELCARRLKPGGIMCTWSPTPRTYATFCEVFPHVLDMNNGEFVLGSNDPLPVDTPQWQARVRTSEVSSYLGSQLTEALLGYLPTGRPADRKSVSWLEPNRDLFPRDEFKTRGGRKRTPPQATQ